METIARWKFPGTYQFGGETKKPRSTRPDQIREALKSGKSIKEVMWEFGISRGTVQWYRKKLGLTRKYILLTPERKAEILEYIRMDGTIRFACKEHGISRSTIMREMKYDRRWAEDINEACERFEGEKHT